MGVRAILTDAAGSTGPFLWVGTQVLQGIVNAVWVRELDKKAAMYTIIKSNY